MIEIHTQTWTITKRRDFFRKHGISTEYAHVKGTFLIHNGELYLKFGNRFERYPGDNKPNAVMCGNCYKTDEFSISFEDWSTYANCSCGNKMEIAEG